MSVIVATAYMDEAQRFDWLVAMDAGRVLATGTPAELLSAHAHRDRWTRPSSPCCRRRNGAATEPVMIPPLAPGRSRGDRHRGHGPHHALR